MELRQIVIELTPLAKLLRGRPEGITECVLQTFLDLLCGRFQDVVPNIGPTSDFRTTRTTCNKGIVCGSFTITFSDERVAAAFATTKRYWNVRIHESIPLKVELGESYSAPRVEP